MNLTYISIGTIRECECCDCECPEDEDCTCNNNIEPYFSWGECDLCETSLGGDRYDGHGIDENGEIVHIAICEDCDGELG